MMDYDFELDRVTAEIRGSDAKRVGLQFPEGLKDRAFDIARHIEAETGAETVILSDPTYGACDMKECQAGKLGLDLLIHFGHTELKPSD